MQVRRRRTRLSAPLTVLSIVGALVAATIITSLGTGSASAQEASFEPTGEVSFPPTPTEPPTEELCSGGDTAGELPSGDQSIVGRVTNGLGAPIADLEVRIGTGQFKSGSVLTSADGSYVFASLGDASYLISFFDQGGTYQSGFYAGSATPALTPAGATQVHLSGAGATGIDAVLANESLHTASGRVTQFGGAGLSAATVTLRPMYFPPPACTTTAGDGTYTVRTIRTGAYRLQVSKDGFPYGFYRAGVPGNFTTHHSEATPLTVDTDLSGLDIAFPELFSLSGTVADAGGTPRGGFYIGASETVPGASGNASSEEPTGQFTIEGLPAGQYFVNYGDFNQVYMNGWYAGDGTRSPSVAGAMAVTVPGPAVQLLAELAPTVTGTITPGISEDTVYVTLCDNTEEQNCFGDYADATGEYAVHVLVPGTYRASVSDYSGTYLSGWFIGTGGTAVWDPADALEILVADTDLGPYNATLPEGGRIAAAVVSGGAPMPYAYVEVCRDEFICPDAIIVDDTGAGQSPAMRPGTYYLRAYNADYSAQYWYVEGQVGSAAFAEATPVDVVVGETVTITFEVPVAVGGTPTEPGERVEPVEVVLGDGTGTTPVSVTFSDVEASGTTTLTTSETSEFNLPSGFQLGLPAIYYDISTTAGVVYPAVVCITYGDVLYMDEANLRLFHYESGAWEDITVPPVDTDNNRICGSTNSLSPFVLGERIPQFSGFFQPVDNGVLNKAKAGAGIPVKFSLAGDFGLDIFADGYPSVSVIPCNPGATVDAIEQTVSVGSSSSLEYDAASDRYVYRFKSAKSWVGTCQRLTLVFMDGTVQTADFKFTK